MKRILFWVLGILLVTGGIETQTIQDSEAHVPGVTASCAGVHLTGTNYDGSKQNKWSVTIAGVTQSGTFGSSLDKTFPVPQAGATTAWSGTVQAYDGGYKETNGGNVGPCGTKPEVKDASADVTTTPGTCSAAGTAVATQQNATLDAPLDTSVGTHTAAWTSPTGHLFANSTHHYSKSYTVEGANNNLCAVCTACHLPYQTPTVAGTTYCKGILVGGVYDDIVVPHGADCTIVNGYVNGQVSAVNAHNLTLGNTDVRGSVVADGVWNLTIGSTNTVCSADPRIGGSLFVRGAHNVVLCNVQVCHAVYLKHLTGRVIYKASRSNRLVVTHNDTFVKDGSPSHHHLDSVRLFNDSYHTKVIRHNKRPVDRRNLHHVGRIGGSEPCRLV